MGYSKEIYRAAQQELDRRREQAQQTAEQRRTELNAAIPALAQIERELAATGMAAVQAAIHGAPDAPAKIESLRTQNLALQEKRACLLRDAGFPPDFLSIPYACPHCQDSGYIAQKRCNCMERLLRQIACRKVSDNSEMKDCRFETFSLSYYSDLPGADGKVPRRVMEKVLQACVGYARSFSLDSDSLLFRGNTGLGKTHLSLSIAFEVIEKGFGVYYASCQSLMDKLQNLQFNRERSGDTDYQQIALECDLLILDDLGAEFSTSFTVASLQNVVNSRLTSGRPTIISTNLDTHLLGERYGERMVSRLLCAYQPFPFCGEDIRMLKRYH